MLQLEMRNVSRILTEAQSEQTPSAQTLAGKPQLSLLVTGSVLLSAQRIRILTDGAFISRCRIGRDRPFSRSIDLSPESRALLYEDLQYVDTIPASLTRAGSLRVSRYSRRRRQWWSGCIARTRSCGRASNRSPTCAVSLVWERGGRPAITGSQILHLKTKRC